MMEYTVRGIRHLIGEGDPRLSIIIPLSEDYVERTMAYIPYFQTMEMFSVEILLSVCVEGFSEPAARNAGRLFTTSDFLAFSNCRVYPPPGVLFYTVAELEADQEAVVMALRLDGTETGEVAFNHYALGDWQCMTKNTFDELGGFSPYLINAGGIEFDLLSKAYVQGRRMVILDERVYHSYHAQMDKDDYRRLAAQNVNATTAHGLPQLLWNEIDLSWAIWPAEGKAERFQMERQRGSILPAIPSKCRPEEDLWVE